MVVDRFVPYVLADEFVSTLDLRYLLSKKKIDLVLCGPTFDYLSPNRNTETHLAFRCDSMVQLLI